MRLMLQILDTATSQVFLPVAGGDLGRIAKQVEAPTAGVVWIDAVDPSQAELDQLVAAFGWAQQIAESVDADENRQRAVRVGDSMLVVVRPPLGDGEVAIVVHGALAVTVRYLWDRALDDAVLELRGWPDLTNAHSIAVACVVLARIIEAYEDASDELEDRLVQQESSILASSRGGDPMPALRETAALRGAVGDVRRRSNRLRELLGVLVRQELLDRRHGEAVDLDLRDIYDHLIRVHDDLDAYSDRLIALQESRLSIVAYRQNDITKRISGWAAVLLIPTITTGWFGQNFQSLALIHTSFGPWIALGGTAVVMAAAATFLRRAGWL